MQARGEYMDLALAMLAQSPDVAKDLLDSMAERLETFDERAAREEEEGTAASEILQALVRARGPVGR